jgi:uncharacterized membrane protein YoaK (UPF0700 family)
VTSGSSQEPAGGSSRAPAGLARQLTLAAVLLTIGTGGTDVLALTRLGGVFASVMTGNLVLLALAAGALINGILVEHAPTAVPAVIIAPLCVVLALRATARRHNRRPAPTT